MPAHSDSDETRRGDHSGGDPATPLGRRRREVSINVQNVILGGSGNVQGAGSGAQPPAPDNRSLWRRLLTNSWFVTLVGGVIAALLAPWLFSSVDNDRSDTEAGPVGGRSVEVYNRIIIGSRRTREDDGPLRLANSPSICNSNDCYAAASRYYTGNHVAHVVCQTRGEWVTNGNETTRADDENPRLFSSRLWYGARLSSERMGFFSAVWAHPKQRDGQRLPDCRSNSVLRR